MDKVKRTNKGWRGSLRLHINIEEALLPLGLKYPGKEIVLPEMSDIGRGGEVTW